MKYILETNFDIVKLWKGRNEIGWAMYQETEEKIGQIKLHFGKY